MSTIRLTLCGDKPDRGLSPGCGYFSHAPVPDVGCEVGSGKYKVRGYHPEYPELVATDGVCLNPNCRKAWSWKPFADEYGHFTVIVFDPAYERRRGLPLEHIRTRSSAALAVFG